MSALSSLYPMSVLSSLDHVVIRTQYQLLNMLSKDNIVENYFRTFANHLKTNYQVLGPLINLGSLCGVLYSQ